METIHLFEDSYYLVGNKAVAKCFMFRDERDCSRFKLKIDYHLKSLCDVLAYGFLKDEFQLVVRLKSRKVFEEYYKQKYDYKPDEGQVIPETTYIFAQAMSNLQSGYVKFFNYKYERDGGLMCGRYFRRLIRSEKELDSIISAVNAMQVIGQRSRIWTFRRKEAGFRLELIKDTVTRSSRMCYQLDRLGKRLLVEAELGCFSHKETIYLRGHFDHPPPKRIPFANKAENLKSLLSFMFMKQK